MNLKFHQVSWDEKHLMYVEFSYQGKLLRWYPKWKHVAELLSDAFATESGINRSKLTPYLSFVCLETLLREHLPPADFATLRDFNEVLDRVREAFFPSVTVNP